MEPGVWHLSGLIGLFVQSVILYRFLDTPLCGTLLTYDFASVGLPFSTSELEEENIVTESLVVIQL